MAPNLFYRWKDDAEQERKQRLGGEALPQQKPRRPIVSGNSNERWGESRWRLKS